MTFFKEPQIIVSLVTIFELLILATPTTRGNASLIIHTVISVLKIFLPSLLCQGWQQ